MASQWLNFIEFQEWIDFYLSTQDDQPWPVANDPRRLQPFWISNQGPLIAPMYSRIVTRHTIAPGVENRLVAYLELEPDDDGNAFADSGLNELGRRLTVTLRNWTEPHPVYNEIGVSWDWEYTRVGFSATVTFGVFNMPNTSQHEFTPYWYDWPFNRGTDPVIRSAQVYLNAGPGTDTDWENFTRPENNIKWHSISFGRSVPNNPGISPYPPTPATGTPPRLTRRRRRRSFATRVQEG